MKYRMSISAFLILGSFVCLSKTLPRGTWVHIRGKEWITCQIQKYLHSIVGLLYSHSCFCTHFGSERDSFFFFFFWCIQELVHWPGRNKPSRCICQPLATGPTWLAADQAGASCGPRGAMLVLLALQPYLPWCLLISTAGPQPKSLGEYPE